MKRNAGRRQISTGTRAANPRHEHEPKKRKRNEEETTEHEKPRQPSPKTGTQEIEKAGKTPGAATKGIRIMGQRWTLRV